MKENIVFISYARADGEEFARRLHNDLESNSQQAWLDVFDIPKGADWNRAIDKGLQTADTVVVVVTPGSVTSLQVTAEWNYAINHYIPVIPLMVLPAEMPRVLNVFNYIDFQADYFEGFKALLSKIKNVKDDHLLYLQETYRALQVARDSAANPVRFDGKLESLKEAIDTWSGRVQAQKKRISAGLDALNTSNDEVVLIDPKKSAVRIIGRRLLEVNEFFKDRDHERNSLAHALLDHNVRLVSLIGRGGMGKTALASKVLADGEKDVWQSIDTENSGLSINAIIYLSTRTTGISLEQIYTRCVELLPESSQKRVLSVWRDAQINLEARLRELLSQTQPYRYVLLLDNIEDIQNSDGSLRDNDVERFLQFFLEFQHKATIIVTSRIPLRLPTSLLRYDNKIHLTDGLPENDCIELLRELDPNGEFDLRDSDLDTLKRLVKVTHGVPRALEVVAGILANDPFTSVEDILAEFYDMDDAVEKLVEENFKRLDADARHVIEALAVYRRPVPVLAVDYLLEPFFAGIAVPAILKRLINTHIVSVDRQTKTVSLHPIDVDYAYSQISEHGTYSKQALEKRAAEYYAYQKNEVKDNWNTINDVQNHLLEFEHLIRAGEFGSAALTLNSITEEMTYRGYSGMLLDMHEQVKDHIIDRKLQIQQLLGIGSVYLHTSALEQARETYYEALTLAEEIDDKRLQAWVLRNLCETRRFQGDIDDALFDNVKKALDIFKTLDDGEGTCATLFSLSMLHIYRNELQQGISYGTLIEETASKFGLIRWLARGHNALAVAYLISEKYDQCIKHCVDALRIYRQVNDRDAIQYMHNTRALAELGLERIDEAFAEFSQALNIATEDTNVRVQAMVLYNISHLHHLSREFSEALQTTRKAARLFADINADQDAKTALALGDALDARIENDLEKYAHSLLRCAKISSDNADTFSSKRLTEIVVEISEIHDFATIKEEAAIFYSELKKRLAFSDE